MFSDIFKGTFSLSDKAFYMTRYPWMDSLWPDSNYFVRYRFLEKL